MALTDLGTLALAGLGEATEAEIFEFCYPDLESALAANQPDIRDAVNRERSRICERVASHPATELGRRMKDHSDAPTATVNRSVTRAARRALNSLRLQSDCPPPPTPTSLTRKRRRES